jgi:hypothetical protein
MHPNEVATKLVDIALQSNDAKLWARTTGVCEFQDGVDLRFFWIVPHNCRLGEVPIGGDGDNVGLVLLGFTGNSSTHPPYL